MDKSDDIDSHRTRIGIATSCISTIFLCTWVAFHPNIPGPKERKWRIIRRRIGCMIGGVLAPEIYVLLAARQFVAARYLARTCRLLYFVMLSNIESHPLIWVDRKQGWTLTHGFFALMGGFMEYRGLEPFRVGFYDPEFVALERSLAALETLEHRLATRIQDSNSESHTINPGVFNHILDVLQAIKRDPATSEVAFQQLTQSLPPTIYLDDCITIIRYYNHRLSDPSKRNFIIYDETSRRKECRCLEYTITLVETFEGALPPPSNEKLKSRNTVDGTTSGDGTLVAADGWDFVPTANEHKHEPRMPIPRINEQDIQDKSQSDILAKTLALFQVIWFILQLSARHHEKLAITDLEYFTLAFCVLNFVTCALWWKKPFAVDRAYAIRRRDNNWDVVAPPVPPFVEVHRAPFFPRIRKWMYGIWKGRRQILTVHDPLRAFQWAYLFAIQVGRRIHRATLPSLFSRFVGATHSPSYRPSWDLSRLRRRIKYILWRARDGIKLVTKLVFLRMTRGQTKLFDSGERVSTFSPKMMKLQGYEAIMYYLSGCILISVFGSIHFLAWSSGPTNTDNLIWRICTICVTVLPMAVFLGEKYTDLLFRERGFVGDVIEKIVLIFGVVLLTAPLFYVLARFGLLILAVRSLLYCPPSALLAVSWSQFVPHF